LSWGTHQVVLILHRRLLDRRLNDLLPLLLTLSQTEGAIRVLVDVALLEHLVDLLLHATHVLEILLGGGHLLLHLLEAPHLLSDVGLLLLLLEFLLLDLCPGLPPLGTWLHHVAGVTLGDYRKKIKILRVKVRKDNLLALLNAEDLPEIEVDWLKIWAICGSMAMMLLPSRAIFWLRKFTCCFTHAWKGSPMIV
jgi:hypothetical protein